MDEVEYMLSRLRANLISKCLWKTAITISQAEEAYKQELKDSKKKQNPKDTDNERKLI
jgi:hypothetical protein